MSNVHLLDEEFLLTILKRILTIIFQDDFPSDISFTSINQTISSLNLTLIRDVSSHAGTIFVRKLLVLTTSILITEKPTVLAFGFCFLLTF